MRLRPLIALTLGAAAAAVSVGLVLAQDAVAPPPAGAAPPTESAPSAPAALAPRAPVIVVPEGEPPEEGAAPPPEIANEAAAPAEPLPSPEVKKGDPQKRARFQSAILQAVDKTTAQTLRFEAKVNEPVRYKGLVITVHACENAAPDEGIAESAAHIDVQAQPEAAMRTPARVVFRGWMFASSPGLHPVEHPLYDVWVIACKTAAPAPATVAKL